MTKRLDDNQEFINTILNEANWSQANVQVKLDEEKPLKSFQTGTSTRSPEPPATLGRPSKQGSGKTGKRSDAQIRHILGGDNQGAAEKLFAREKATVPTGPSRQDTDEEGNPQGPTGGIEPRTSTGEDIDPEAPRMGSENKLKNIQAAFHSRQAQRKTDRGPDGRSVEPVIGPNASQDLGYDPKLSAAGAKAKRQADLRAAELAKLQSPGVETGQQVGTMAVRIKRPDGTYEDPKTAGERARNVTQVKNILTPPPKRDLASTDYSLKYDACPLCESQLEDDEVIFENIGDHFNSLLNVLNKVEAINEGEEVDFDDLLTESHEDGKCPLCESFVEDDQVIMTNMNEHFDVILEMLEEAEEEEGINIEDIPQGSGKYKPKKKVPKPGSIAARGNPAAIDKREAETYN